MTVTGKTEGEENGVYMKGNAWTAGGLFIAKMKRKVGKRESAGVFAIIIIASFLPRMLRKQQVAALARFHSQSHRQIVRDNDESQSKSGD